MGWDRRVGGREDRVGIEITLFIHGNFIKFTNVVYIGNLLYLKAVWYTNTNRTTECVIKLHNLIG